MNPNSSSAYNASYSSCIALAIIHFGENWYRDCSILLTNDGYRVSTKQPTKGSIRL